MQQTRHLLTMVLHLDTPVYLENVALDIICSDDELELDRHHLDKKLILSSPGGESLID